MKIECARHGEALNGGLMAKIDETVRRETLYIAAWTLLFSVLMEAVFLLTGYWHYEVLLGNMLGALFAVLNFFLMGLTVQKALQKEEKDAKTMMKASQSMRMIMLLVVCILGGVLPFFNLFAVLIPLIFPRIAVMLRPLFKH